MEILEGLYLQEGVIKRAMLLDSYLMLMKKLALQLSTKFILLNQKNTAMAKVKIIDAINDLINDANLMFEFLLAHSRLIFCLTVHEFDCQVVCLGSTTSFTISFK